MPIRNEYQVHMLNDKGIEKANQLAEKFSELHDFIEAVATPEFGVTIMPNGATQAGRELALVRTKLQEASFWAKRAMAVNPDNQNHLQRTLPEKT